MVNNLIDSICRATAKEKSRHTADTFPRAYEAAALICRAAASLCPAQDRRPTEGAAMLVRPIFQKHNFLKKDCPHHGSGTDKKMYYTV